jgi:uncharacterized membrane protein YfcA
MRSKTNRTLAILLGIGLTAGVLGGLLGIGGGVFVVPALVFFLAFDQHRAHGTSLAIVIVLSSVSVITYLQHHNVDLVFAAGIALGGMAGAILGGSIVQHIKSSALRRMFCLFLMATAVKMIYDGCAIKYAVATHVAVFSATTALVAVGAGIVTGALSALLGVGGGIVMIPVLTVLLHFEQHAAQGTSLAAMLPIAFTGMLKHNKLGNVDHRVVCWVGLGAAAGALVGSRLANTLNPCALKLTFGIFLVIMAALMAAKK